MPSDAERFRFLSDHELSAVWYDSGASIHWREKWPEPGKTAGYRLVSRAKTLDEAVDVALIRWKRQHGKMIGRNWSSGYRRIQTRDEGNAR